jgi:hypothetical protein
MRGSKDDIQCSMTIASKNLFAATNQINANTNGCGWKLIKTYVVSFSLYTQIKVTILLNNKIIILLFIKKLLSLLT